MTVGSGLVSSAMGDKKVYALGPDLKARGLDESRVIDGVDQSEFFLGNQEKSNREGFIVYMGTDIFGIKWRNWKLNFAEMESALSEKVSYSFLKTYNLHTDPGETDSRTVPDSWVSKAGGALLFEHLDSLKTNPPIATGTPDPYEPPAQ